MSEAWEEAFEAWNKRDDAGEVDLHHSPPAFRAGYVAAQSAQSARQAERAEMVAALIKIAVLIRRTPLGAGDGGTFVLTGREGVEAALIAVRALVGQEGEP